MKNKFLLGLGISFVALLTIAALFVASLFLYKNEVVKEDLLSGIGKPGDKWQIDAPMGQFESVEFIKGEPASGLRSAKNAHIKNIALKKDKSTIYDVDYFYDSFGKRIVVNEKNPPATPPEKFALFFGCSDLLGIGLNSVDTIPALFESRTDGYKAYNFGFVGTGVHYVNRMFEGEDITPEVSEKSGIIVYVITEGHYPKTLGRLGPLIRPVMPFYQLENGEPKYQGALKDVQPLLSQIKKNLATTWLSVSVGGALITQDMKYSDQDDELVCKLLKAAQLNSKKRFPQSRFIAFLHVMMPDSDRAKLRSCAQKNEIEYVDFHVPWDDRFDSDPVYFHPTRFVNDLATNELIKYLK